MADSTTIDMDLHYTNRPFVLDVTTGIRIPRNGFNGHGDRYTINDACLSEKNMTDFEITPDELLQLKLCFDRINRKSKRETVGTGRDDPYQSVATRYWQKRRDKLRSLFNARYFRLRQLAIRTRYRYNMRPYIVTPPIRQCTHQYDTMLRRLCRLDGLSPQELQTKRVFIKQDRNWNSSQGGGVKSKANPRSSHMNNESLQRLWKTMNETELVNKSIKDQTQGGKSFLKQVVIPGKMLNCLYGKVLPDPTLRPDEIGIPSHIMEGSFKSDDMNKVAAVVKRDPVFSSDAITMFTRVVRNPYPYVTLPSEIITNKQLDFDGDNVSIMMVHSGRCFVETLLRLSAKIGMYCYFYRTRLTFSQTNGFRVAGLLEHLDRRVSPSNGGHDGQVSIITTEGLSNDVQAYFGKTFARCRFHVHRGHKVLAQLNETLLSLAQQYGPFVAYGFLMNVRSLSFTGYNARRVYPIGPEPRRMASHIAESGSKGTKEAVDCMFDMRATKESRSMETLEYAKSFIEAKTLIRKQGHNAKKMDSAFQNIIVDHDDHLVVRVDSFVYDLGHIINYMQREWIMSDLTADTILNGVVEDESVYRRITLLECGGEPAINTESLEPPFDGSAEQHIKEVDDSIYSYWDCVIENILYNV